MEKVDILPALRRLLEAKVDYGPPYGEDYAATLAIVKTGIQTILDILEPDVSVEPLQGEDHNLCSAGFSGANPVYIRQ